MVDQKSRLNRQIHALTRRMPATRRTIDSLLHGRLARFRLPIALVLILGSFLAVLPVFGLWMLPLGLLLLALDVPRLQPMVSGLLIRTRRRLDLWYRSAARHRRKPPRPGEAPQNGPSSGG